MKYVEAPDRVPIETQGPILFAAGGITGCPDWQKELQDLLSEVPGVYLNPRRAVFPMDKPEEAERQIRWEHVGLRMATAISFWFAKETIQPIVLFELGSALERWHVAPGNPRALFIGVHPDYPRRQDVEIQTKLISSNIVISYSLNSLAGRISGWAYEYNRI